MIVQIHDSGGLKRKDIRHQVLVARHRLQALGDPGLRQLHHAGQVVDVGLLRPAIRHLRQMHRHGVEIAVPVHDRCEHGAHFGLFFEGQDVLARSLRKLDLIEIDGDARKLKQPGQVVRLRAQGLLIELQPLLQAVGAEAGIGAFDQLFGIVLGERDEPVRDRRRLLPSFHG